MLVGSWVPPTKKMQRQLCLGWHQSCRTCRAKASFIKSAPFRPAMAATYGMQQTTGYLPANKIRIFEKKQDLVWYVMICVYDCMYMRILKVPETAQDGSNDISRRNAAWRHDGMTDKGFTLGFPIQHGQWFVMTWETRIKPRHPRYPIYLYHPRYCWFNPLKYLASIFVLVIYPQAYPLILACSTHGSHMFQILIYHIYIYI